MKLYFYFLRNLCSGYTFISREECEVIEKGNSYYPVGRFPIIPIIAWRSSIKKDEIGGFLNNYFDTIILDKDDSEKAMKLFEEQSKRTIEELNINISIEKSILKAVEDYRKNG